MNKMVSVQQAVLNSVEDIGVENVDTTLIQRWCTEAEKAIGGKYQYVMERKVIPIKNNRFASLPNGTFHVLSCFLGDVGEDCSYMWAGGYGGVPTGFDPLFTISDWEKSLGVTIITGSAFTSASTISNYSIIDNQIAFDCDVTGYTDITVYVLCYQMDSNGFIKVAEEHLEAITYYVKLKTAERSMFGPSRVPMNMLGYLKRVWGQKKSIARELTSKMTTQEEVALQEMVNNPLSGKVVDFQRYLSN